MSDIINNEKRDNTMQSPSAVAEGTGSAIVAEKVVLIDAAAAGDAASLLNAEKPPLLVESSPNMDNKRTPVKRTPSKRMSFIERAQKESEELVKNMGGSLELEGGRRTRSSTRGTPTHAAVATTPPPNKKARASPAANAASSRARGRGRKIDISADLAEEVAIKLEPKESAAEKQTSGDDSAPVAKENHDVQPISASPQKTVVKESNEDKAIEGDGATAKTAALEQAKPVGTASSEGETAAADDMDAPLESVQEETENDIEHEKTKSIQKAEVAKSVSPMDVDEQQIEPESEPEPGSERECESDAVEPVAAEPTRLIAAVSVEQSKAIDSVPAEATVKSTSAAEVTHVPAAIADTPKEVLPTATVTSPTADTPEPMEVDSNSKSNDLPDSPTEAAEVVDTVFAGVNEHNNTSPVAESVSASANAETPPTVTGVLASTATNAIAIDENGTVRPAAMENANSTETKLAIEVSSMASADDNTTKNDTVANESKHQNNFCEPEIASPPMNAAPEGSTTTPQYCN